MPRAVVDAVSATLASPVSNRGRHSAPQRAADQIVHDCRAALADLLAADPRGIVFGRSMTAITYDVSRALARTWGPGDEVVVTRLDHDANVRPWVQAAEAAGATVRWVDFDPATAELGTADLEAVLSDRTRLVAVTAASNVLGTMPDVAALAALAHAAGALVYVDGVHHAAHEVVDVAALWGRTSSRARRTSSGARTAARWPPTRRCSRRSCPTSWCRRPTPCPSGSSSARSPTS